MLLIVTKEIKIHIFKLLDRLSSELKGKIVIDIPAGSGESSHYMAGLGAKVLSYDLFPEFFKKDSGLTGLYCQYADLGDRIPLHDQFADFVLCQEGIEHISDQQKLLHEIARVLKIGGQLILTTPNYSNLRSRISYLINESEYYKFMPPNEIESVWMSEKNGPRIYYGHVFMVGIQKLRLLSLMAGFQIIEIVPNGWNRTSVLLVPFLYPLVVWGSFFAYLRALRKNKKNAWAAFGEQLKINLSPNILCCNHLIIRLKKKKSFQFEGNKISSFHERT